ncbi:hypothetical protein Tco_0542982 [Tanacetum coccineum]
MWMISSLFQQRRSYGNAFEKLKYEKFQIDPNRRTYILLRITSLQKSRTCKATTKTSNENSKPLLNDEDGRKKYQVNPKVSHLHDVKRIFRYLKSQPKLGLWYPNDSSFDLVAYTDSDYAGANLDKKSTIGGCQFLGSRLISWQCKKQTVVANSTTKAEYVAASSCCG